MSSAILLQDRWQVEFPDGYMRGPCAWAGSKKTTSPQRKNVNLQSPTYLETTRIEKAPLIPPIFSLLASLSFKCSQWMIQLFILVWDSLNCKWMQKRKYSWNGMCNIAYIIPRNPTPGAVLDRGYRLNQEGCFRKSQWASGSACMVQQGKERGGNSAIETHDKIFLQYN